MKLHELTEKLESEATKLHAAQSATIRDLLAKNLDLEHRLHLAQNRCLAVSHGVLCSMCSDTTCNARTRLRGGW